MNNPSNPNNFGYTRRQWVILAVGTILATLITLTILHDLPRIVKGIGVFFFVPSYN
jgi:hypothetical protein